MVAVLRGVIAMDGPSGTGKTTVARSVATQLRAGYLDTGAMYRAATLAVLRSGAHTGDPVAVADAVDAAEIAVATDPAQPATALDGVDVSAEIRGEDVTSEVSAVSAVAAVRQELVTRQRQIIDTLLAAGQGIVVEGRDIGTVVAPSAPLKVYLTASQEVRTQRRAEQNAAAGLTTDNAAVRAAVDRRDRLDSARTVDPMRQATDAVAVDTSALSLDDVVAALLQLVQQRGLLVEAQP